MDLVESYRLLRLPKGASYEQVKAAYRHLARQFHPDVNRGDRTATEQFIQITQAYKCLMAEVKPSLTAPVSPPQPAAKSGQRVRIHVQENSPKPAPKVQFNPDLSPAERQLKQQFYEQLQTLLKTRRFPRAIALVEGLANRMPKDPEVGQWQAIAYQQWGRYLIQQGQLDKARIYLKKALRTDPHNQTLWAEVEKDFRRLEQVF